MATYQQQVKAAASALVKGDDANWRLAQLTAEATYEKGGQNDKTRVSMETWCKDVREASGRKFSEITGRRYKQVWLKYGNQIAPLRSDLNWSEAYESVRGETIAEVRDRIESKPARTNGYPYPPKASSTRLDPYVPIEKSELPERRESIQIPANTAPDAVGKYMERSKLCDQLSEMIRTFCGRVDAHLEKMADKGALPTQQIFGEFLFPSTLDVLDKVVTRLRMLSHSQSAQDLIASALESEK